jgi:hypothetical protein
MICKPLSSEQPEKCVSQEIEGEANGSETQALAKTQPKILKAQAKPKLPRRRKRLRLSEAMRAQGIDEQMIAEAYAGVVINLRENESGAGKEKVLLDVLKECTRALADKSGHIPEPVTVQLVHNIPRPVRNMTEPSGEK